METIETLFLHVLEMDPAATMGGCDAPHGFLRWRVNLVQQCSRSIYGRTIVEALERAIVVLATHALEDTLFPSPTPEE